ncbi:sugar-binding domain-containing protein [uncultured Veillonella sp.]|uniref:sugar-binding domain-containing protein n=1 Tax=uncultured Veillonella sp. TaxID=159268 RepID=UPI00261086BF|nr:sugar-binding domain-containing protein [uncultured Veillonella sp.]
MSTMELLQPVDNASRDCLDLSGQWFFAFDSSKDKSYESGVARDMTVPVPAALQDVFVLPEERAYCGTMWYERQVFIPKRWLGSDVFLRFDGIGNRAVVYVNGIEAGRHEGIYTSSSLNVTRQLRYGEDNRIVVKVNNELSPYALPAGQVITSPKGQRVNQSHFDFSVPTGIYGRVALYTVPSTRLTDVMVQTVELSKEKAVLQYMAHVQGNCLVTATLRTRDGRIIATGVGGNAKLVIDDPQIWSIGKGYLYNLELEVSRLGKQHDSYTLKVGLRTTAVENGNFKLNGEMTRLKAVLWSKPYGDELVMTPWQIKQRMLQILALGGNCIYSGGRPLGSEVLAMADACGLLVIGEIPGAGLLSKDLKLGEANFNKIDIKSRLLEAHKEAIQDLIRRDKNHPSIVTWSLMYNPVTIMKDDEMYYQALADTAKEADWEERPLSMTLNHAVNTIWMNNLNSYAMIILTRWAKEWQKPTELLQSQIYKELIDWDAKHPEKAIAVFLNTDVPIHSMSFGMYKEQTEKLKALLLTLLNAQGELFQISDATLYDALKLGWKS